MAVDSPAPMITIAVPSLNQGRYLDRALSTIFAAGLPVEVFLADGGSTDCSLGVIEKWSAKLSGWRSGPDQGQAAAINECIAQGTAPFVAWLNSDDGYLPGGLRSLLDALERDDQAPFSYGLTTNVNERTEDSSRVWVEPFSERRLANRCIVSQPGTLIRRESWVAVAGLDEALQVAMDYDLWWRLFRQVATPRFVPHIVAYNREHGQTKTRSMRRSHYSEAIGVVRRHYGRVPIKWWLYWPIAVWWRSLWSPQRGEGGRAAGG
jgi:glycosyltransferase involved in cell wall biosynthesis